MESKELDTIARQLDKKVKQRDKAMQARQKHQERRSERLQTRLQPYSELAERNRNVVYRAKQLMDLTGGGRGRSTVVILGETEKSDLTPNHFTVCRLEGGQYRDYDKNSCVLFQFPYVRDTQIKGIQESGILNLPYDSAPRRNDVVIRGPSEDTFRIYQGEHSSDELMAKGYNHASKKTLEPIQAIGRVFDLMKRNGEVRRLEETMGMIEQAAMDPALNPYLAGELASSREVEAWKKS